MIDRFFQKRSLPRYRITQFNHAMYKDFIGSFDDLTTWPKELREALKKEISFSSISFEKSVVSKDKQTIKALFSKISDKKRFESVLMKHRDGRNTVCVSCMIGCPVGCFFCATGQMGAHGSLTSEEIVDQVLYFARELKKENAKVTNIVFMGMGEPLLNLENVLSAIKVFKEKEYMAMSERRITISTSGITPKIHALLEHDYRGKLTLSLHASTQKLRETLMPIAKKYPLKELLDACKTYAKKTNKRVSYEYMLIDRINDSPQHAKELASLLGSYLTHINLIPYNPVLKVAYKRSSTRAIQQFSRILSSRRIPHTIRVTMGADITAACGQLATT